MRKLQSYVAKYGPVAGPRLYHALQSQAAHAGVSARLRRKIERLSDTPATVEAQAPAQPSLPFMEAAATPSGPGPAVAVIPRPE